MPVPDPLKPYRLYVAMFLLNLAVVIGVVYLLRRDTPRPIVITRPPTRALPDKSTTRAPSRATLAPASNNLTGATAAPAPGQKINLNTATLAELDTLPGIGPTLAQRILDYRAQIGSFQTIDQIKDVRGIGDTLFDDIKERISVPMNSSPLSFGFLAARMREPSTWINVLLIFVPIAIILEFAHGDPTLLFVTSALGIVPLAGLLGEATDALAVKAGDRIGALLNATLGNAAELIITIVALQAGLVDVVKASITGSIIGNLLLVLGVSLLAGGLKNGVQRFDRGAISVMMTTMTIAIIGLVVPTLFGTAIESVNHQAVEYLSIGVALALMTSYVISLIFTFRQKPSSDEIATAEDLPVAHEPKHGIMKDLRIALAVLLGSVVLLAFLSEILVGAVEPLIEAQGLSELFVGVIIVPIIGNAAEHIVAVEMALKNRMELALGIAIGSSLQIAVFVAPLLVFIALLLGQELTLVFNPFELSALLAAVIITALISLDGESNWLEGAQLLIVYIILAIAFFFLPNITETAQSLLVR